MRALSPKQADYLSNSDARVNVCDGSIRSGKTFVTLMRWLTFIAKAPKGGQLIMVGRTRDAVWRNLILPMQEEKLFGPVANAIVGNDGAPTVKILGRTSHLFGASHAKAGKSRIEMTSAGSMRVNGGAAPTSRATRHCSHSSIAISTAASTHSIQ